MFSHDMNINSSDERLQSMKNVLEEITKMDVLVGIPQEKSTRQGDEITNAELAFIHTNGSPVRGIPARPFIEPAIEDDKQLISQLLGEAIQSYLSGDKAGAEQKLNQAGLEGQAASQDWFTSPKNGWAPNSPAVQALKIKKGSTDPKPLIDTGELRKSITYVIRKKG